MSLKRNKDSPLYIRYHMMKQRCLNKNAHNYHHYGGRGIKICDRWLESFQNFHDDMIKGYKKGLTLDRINNDGDYEKSNCRWTTQREQSLNRRKFKQGKRKRVEQTLSRQNLFEIRAFYIKKIIDSGLSQADAAFIFNVHPSQITRSLKI